MDTILILHAIVRSAFLIMEDETRLFLIKILQTISIILLWMMVNVFFGLYKQFAYFDNAPTLKNYIFYTLSLSTLIGVIIHLKHKWQV